MAKYTVTWITDYLAVGHAPMSYDDLDNIRAQGISGIVNLCGEFSDLHEIEESAGFEVFYLPIPDETAPNMEQMEKALEWLDEAVYLGKKVLVHCKLGVGRTGTFVTAYMLRRGFNLKKAGKLLKKTRANPTNYSQWWLLRKFGKKEGQLKLIEPSAANRSSSDLSRFFERYEQLLEKIDAHLESGKGACCGKDAEACSRSFQLSLIEALYLNNKVNVALSSAQRSSVIEKAASATGSDTPAGSEPPAVQGDDDAGSPLASNDACPLRQGDQCLLEQYRPIHCRISGCETGLDMEEINREIAALSEEVFQTLFAASANQPLSLPEVSNRETISGKFIQRYFQYLVTQKAKEEQHKS